MAHYDRSEVYLRGAVAEPPSVPSPPLQKEQQQWEQQQHPRLSAQIERGRLKRQGKSVKSRKSLSDKGNNIMAVASTKKTEQSGPSASSLTEWAQQYSVEATPLGRGSFASVRACVSMKRSGDNNGSCFLHEVDVWDTKKKMVARCSYAIDANSKKSRVQD